MTPSEDAAAGLALVMPRLHLAGVDPLPDTPPVLLRQRAAEGDGRWRAVWRIGSTAGPLCLKMIGPGFDGELLRREVWMARHVRGLLDGVPGVAVPEVLYVFPRLRGILYGWADGTDLRTALQGRSNGAEALALLRRAGAALGALHRAEPPQDEGYRAEAMIARLAAEGAAGLPGRLDRRRLQLEALWRSAGDQRAAISPVHGDAQLHNLIAGGTALWLIDFGNAHRGLPLNDVDAFLTDACASRTGWFPARSTGALGHGRAIEEAFLEGYGAPPAHGPAERLLAATQLFGRVAHLNRRRRLLDVRLAALAALLDRRIASLG